MSYYSRPILMVMLTTLLGCAPAIKEGAPMIKTVKMPDHLIHTNAAVKANQDDWHMDEWWQIFKNQQLNQLIKSALQDSPTVAEANSRLSIAQAGLMQTAAVQFPRIDSEAKATNLHYSRNGDHGTYNGQTNTVATFNPLVVNYHADFFGKDKEIIDSASASVEIAQAKLNESAIRLRQSVIKTYFSLKIADEIILTQLQVLELAKDIEKVKICAYQSGIQPTAYTFLPNLYVSETKVSLATVKQKKSALLYALANLLGNGPDSTVALTPKMLVIPEQLPIPKTINLDAIAKRPDIQAALWNIHYATHVEKAAQLDFYPNINLSALLGLNSIGISNLFKSGSVNYAVGPVLSLPIFDHGALQGKFSASAAAYDAAVFVYNQTILNAAKEVATNLANLDHTKNILEEQSSVLQQRIELANSATAEYNSGLSDKIPDLEAKITQKNAYIELLQARLQWLYAITDMATALDGKFQEAVNDAKN